MEKMVSLLHWGGRRKSPCKSMTYKKLFFLLNQALTTKSPDAKLRFIWGANGWRAR